MKAFAFLLVLFCMMAIGCTSNPNKPQEISTSLDAKGSTSFGTIGLNDSGEAVVQEERLASVELTATRHVNENLKMDLQMYMFKLKQCRKAVAAKSGEYPEMTSLKGMSTKVASKEVLGIEKGELKVVKTEYLKESIAAERRNGQELAALIEVVKEQQDKCEFLKENGSI